MGYVFSLSRSGTELALNWSEAVLFVFGAILVAGLVGEYRAAERSRWMKFFELLVIVGVLGELVADAGVFVFSNHLESTTSIEVAALNKEAGEARVDAANVTASQKSQDVQIAQANTRAAEAQAKAAAAGLEQERLRQSNIELQSQVEQERTARLRIEARIADRIIDDAARSAMLQELRKVIGGSCTVVALNPDPESHRFAEQINEAFGAAGWRVTNGPGFTTVGGASNSGVFVVAGGTPIPGSAEATLFPIAAVAKRAFEAAHIPVTMAYDKGLSDSQIFVNVWPKPVPR